MNSYTLYTSVWPGANKIKPLVLAGLKYDVGLYTVALQEKRKPTGLQDDSFTIFTQMRAAQEAADATAALEKEAQNSYSVQRRNENEAAETEMGIRINVASARGVNVPPGVADQANFVAAVQLLGRKPSSTRKFIYRYLDLIELSIIPTSSDDTFQRQISYFSHKQCWSQESHY